MATRVTTMPEPSKRSESSCPACGAKGRKVGAVTLLALVRPDARPLKDGQQRFCRTLGCDVVYFAGYGADQVTIGRSEVSVDVFQKSTDPARLVCYCFGHSVADVQADGSDVAAQITEKCRQGLDRCDETNPQGNCCLGNVRAVAHSPGEHDDCCTVSKTGSVA